MLLFSTGCMLIHLVRPSWGAEINSRLGQLSQPVSMLAAVTPAPHLAAQANDAAGQSSLAGNMAEGQLLALAEEVRALRLRNTELMGLRAHDYIPPRLGRLVSSQVISRDSLAYRCVETIDRGSSGGASIGQFVTSAMYLDRGSEDGLQTKRNVFTAESLVGQIIWVGPYTSRVRLLTDPASRLRVRIARIHPDRPKDPVGLSQDTYLLDGQGAQGMVIKEMPYPQVKSGAVKVGDLVVAEPSADLPQEAASLRRVGRITAIQQGASQLSYTLKVAPMVDMERLGHVYVFDPTPVETSPSGK